MTQRFLAGKHPGFGTEGIWLSVPGVDVTLSGPAANFILRSDLKYYQVVISGQISMGPGQGAAVALPTNLVLHPYILIKGNISGVMQYPSDLGAVGGTGADPVEVIIATAVTANGFICNNRSGNYSLVGTFMVFNRSIGS